MSEQLAQDPFREAIDNASKGSGFSCKRVSWEDCARTHNSGQGLSSVGPNISDVRLYAKSATERNGKVPLWTTRSDNWNELLGQMPADRIAVVVPDGRADSGRLKQITLQSYLCNVGRYGSYAGMRTTSLYCAEMDNKIGVRFQTVFLAGDQEVCTHVYNYQARTNNPRNLQVLFTPQQAAVQQDGSGDGLMMLHRVNDGGKITRHWLSSERTDHAVGRAQDESEQERTEAASRGKAIAVDIGVPAMKKRFNVQMLLQVPLVQTTQPKRSWSYDDSDDLQFDQLLSCQSLSASSAVSASASYDHKERKRTSAHRLRASDDGHRESKRSAVLRSISLSARRRACAAKVESAGAARMSFGSKYDTWSGLSVGAAQRDTTQHCTLTITMYYALPSVDALPRADDVRAAIEDLQNLYSSCREVSDLASAKDMTADSMAPVVFSTEVLNDLPW